MGSGGARPCGPAHITFDRNGLGEMQLITIGASIDYRVEERGGAPVVEFSWSGFDEMDPTSGRAWARIEGDTMRGKQDLAAALGRSPSRSQFISRSGITEYHVLRHFERTAERDRYTAEERGSPTWRS